ncbi:MAG: SBBP repeat-containing protein [Ignavibacteria bacterium]|nr:SBBP repeat-containing protein [Ignavibacteria bacterium]
MKNLKLNLLILISIFLSNVEMSLGQVTFDWAKRYSSNQLNAQIAYDVVTDANGNVYVTGNTARGSDVIDMVTIKYNSAGNYIWGKVMIFPAMITVQKREGHWQYTQTELTHLFTASGL